MVTKMLTDIRRQLGELEHTVILVKGAMVEATLELRQWETIGKLVSQYHQYGYLNVQRLMLYMRAIHATKMLPFITPPKTLPPIRSGMLPTFEEELIFRKHLLPLRVLEEERVLRRERLRIEETREKTRILKLHQQAITCIEQRPLAELEKELYTFRLEWYEKILLKLIDMCKAKQLYLERIIGQEPLQKLMLQLYIPFYMEMPSKMNAIGIRLTQATMLYLAGIAGTIYSAIQSVGQAVKTKMQLVPVQKRRLETKALASGKRRREPFQTKSMSDYEEHIWGTTKLKVGKDLTGKEIMAISVAMSYGMPYFLKRWLVRQMGLPENSKLYHKPYTYLIPVRRTLARKMRRPYRKDNITLFNRDEYIKNMRNWRSTHG